MKSVHSVEHRTLPGMARAVVVLQKMLRVFGDVHRGEAVTTLIFTAIGFLLLTCTYIIKVLREALIMSAGGAELKSYTAAGQVVVLSGVAWIYAWLAARFDRVRLIGAVTLFFALNLLVFFFVGLIGQPGRGLGIVFFLWSGIFNVTTLAQYWSFANDVFRREQGQRLFGVVGIGGSLGAVLGARVAGWLFDPLGPGGLMLVGALVLVGCLGLTAFVDRRERQRANTASDITAPPLQSGGEVLRLLLQDRYLLLLAAFTLLINWITTNGDYILDRQLLESARLAAAGGQVNAIAEFVASFRARFFGWVNLVSLLSQCFLVSRIMQFLGVRVALILTPLIWLGGYVSMAVLPTLSIIATARTAESSANYSLQNTARHALFLVTSREAKYGAKTVIDTFVWRAGDVLAAGVVWLGRLLLFGTLSFVSINLGLIVVLLGVVIGTARIYGWRSELPSPRSSLS